MKKGILVLTSILAFSMVGCGRDCNTTNETIVNSPSPTVSAPASSEQDLVNQLVTSENEYREGLGQTALTAGLSCTLYTITGGAYINSTNINGASQSPTLTGQKTAATFLLTQSFNQPNSSVSAGLNVLPSALQGLPQYQNEIELVCTGQLVVTDTNFYAFSLVSDDAGVAYIDGAFVLDDDGQHGAQTVSATKYLRQGVHSFTLKFAQTGAGSQALVFSVNGNPVDPMYFYH